MECTILSGHRRVPPFGLAGGGDGQVGENSVRRKDGHIEKLQGCDATVIDAGEAVIIQTPTAGGYGAPIKKGDKTFLQPAIVSL
jgi:5-oxoprolinase (ATP-hydrolysing)